MTISGRTRVAAVIGHPVAHSRSPAVHNAAFRALGMDAVFVALDIDPSSLGRAVDGFRAQKLLGVSVTVPHKQAVAPLCDELAPSAVGAGAVNCLEIVGERVIGHNTDGAGLIDALARGLGMDVNGRRVVLLGGGGVARGVAAAMSAAGASEVMVVARDPGRVAWCRARSWDPAALARELSTVELLVDCTDTALSPESERARPPVPIAALPGSAAVVSLIYHRRSALLEEAASRGLREMDGAWMLVHQAARAFAIWTGQPAPLEAMWSAMSSAQQSPVV